MPLDATTVDPHISAGLVQGADGTWGLPQQAVPPTPSSGQEVVLGAGGNIPFTPPAGAPAVNLPQVPASPTPVSIDVHVGKEAPTANPVIAAGLVQAPNGDWVSPQVAQQESATQPAIPQSVKNQEVRSAYPPGVAGNPVLETVHDAMNTIESATGGGAQSAAHGMSLGLDSLIVPLVPAIAHSLATGTPFAQSYAQAQQQFNAPRQQFEAQHPALGTATELTGGVASPINVAASPLFAPARAGATSFAQKGVDLARNMLANTGLGAASGFTMTDGDLAQRAAGAEQGAVIGGTLGAVVPAAVKTGAAIGRAWHPTAQIPKLAGQALNEAADTAPSAVPQRAPILNFPVDVGAAYNDPGLAAVVRQNDTMNNAAAVAQRTAQSQAVKAAATTMQPNRTLLARPLPTPEASANLVAGMRAANAVIRKEEERLWTVPEIAQKTTDLPKLKASVRRAIAALPARFKNVIERTPDLKAALADLMILPRNATLADINSIRSDLLGLKRTLPHTEAFAKRVAGEVADAILQAIESNPALRTDPAAWSAYVRAREFTSRKWDVLGHDAFQNMLKSNRYGNLGADDRTAAGQVFGFGDRTAGERVPRGVSGVTSMLDDIRRQWRTLRSGGVTTPGTLDAGTAFAARAELANGARDFIINSMLDGATSVERGITGEQHILMNRLSDWLDTNRPWIAKSGIFNSNQLALLKDIRDSAVLGAATANLRGGKGSETYERLAKDNKFINLFTSPIVRGAAHAGAGIIGAILGGAAGIFGAPVDAGIGALLGMSAEGLGQKFLSAVYAMPREELKAKLEEAIRNPEIAADLRKLASAPGKISDTTQRWARSFLATQGAGQPVRAFSDRVPAPQPPQ